MKPYKDQTASAQNAYADLFDAALAFHVSASITGLNGSFGKKRVHGHDYWYFQFRDIGGAVKQIYLGPESDKLSALILAHRQPANEEAVPMQRLAAAAVALGCEPLLPKHYRVVRRLAEYGFFKRGGILVGTSWSEPPTDVAPLSATPISILVSPTATPSSAAKVPS